MNEYWDTRYQAEGKIWGDSPSRTAEHALKLFQANGVKNLLVPGSGYGRNTRLFSSAGFSVTGVEISLSACGIALEFDPQTRVFQTSVLDMSLLRRKFDAIYSFNTLHLFREFDRKRFIRQCLDRIKNKGLMFFTVFSEQEPTYGKGASVEQDTFESKPGRPVHYFNDGDLKAHFAKTDILETGLMEDEENHGEGPHTHILRYIYVRAV